MDTSSRDMSLPPTQKDDDLSGGSHEIAVDNDPADLQSEDSFEIEVESATNSAVFGPRVNWYTLLLSSWPLQKVVGILSAYAVFLVVAFLLPMLEAGQIASFVVSITLTTLLTVAVWRTTTAIQIEHDVAASTPTAIDDAPSTAVASIEVNPVKQDLLQVTQGLTGFAASVVISGIYDIWRYVACGNQIFSSRFNDGDWYRLAHRDEYEAIPMRLCIRFSKYNIKFLLVVSSFTMLIGAVWLLVQGKKKRQRNSCVAVLLIYGALSELVVIPGSFSRAGKRLTAWFIVSGALLLASWLCIESLEQGLVPTSCSLLRQQPLGRIKGWGPQTCDLAALALLCSGATYRMAWYHSWWQDCFVFPTLVYIGASSKRFVPFVLALTNFALSLIFTVLIMFHDLRTGLWRLLRLFLLFTAVVKLIANLAFLRAKLRNFLLRRVLPFLEDNNVEDTARMV